MSDENAAQNAGATATPAQGSAPENKNEQVTGNQVEVAQKQDHGGEIPKGLKTELFNLRNAKREAQAKAEAKEREAAELKARLDALEARLAQGSQTAKAETLDPFADPEAYAKKVREDARKEALEALEQRDAEAKRLREAHDTEQFILTRQHVKEDPKAVEEINAILVARYADMVAVSPRAAGRAAYLDYCESKGIQPDFGQRSAPDASGVVIRPSVAAPVGSSVPGNATQLKKALDRTPVGSAEYQKLKAEYVKALSAGRK